ncbi:hypothetical protein F5884DRAFT_118295 [Xylogone sp. PMI_703]|nr:hypothetical protein F5884DRAFT_118295 [Xylogone sp. PMI_703]
MPILRKRPINKNYGKLNRRAGTKEPVPVSVNNRDDEVHSIRMDKEGDEIWVYIEWIDGTKTRHSPPSSTYLLCPQKMLKFYEDHLIFHGKSEQETA